MAAASDENHPTLQAARALIPTIRAAAGTIAGSFCRNLVARALRENYPVLDST